MNWKIIFTQNKVDWFETENKFFTDYGYMHGLTKLTFFNYISLFEVPCIYITSLKLRYEKYNIWKLTED